MKSVQTFEKLSFYIEGEFYRYFCHFSLDSISISICDLCKDIYVHGSIFCTLAFSMIHSSSHNFSVHQKTSMFASEMLDFLGPYALRKLLIGKMCPKDCHLKYLWWTIFSSVRNILRFPCIYSKPDGKLLL